MNILDIIEKKKHGLELTRDEILYFVLGAADGSLPDYQLSALLMAIWFSGLTDDETLALTLAMRDSGEVLDLSSFGLTADKHSTGGVGDKISLIAMPLWRAGGLTVAKMSGRGLGFTGGTVDKLESVPGFNASLDKDSFFRCVEQNGICVTGQSASLDPADKRLYSLRDVTGTIDSLPLIAASIMSKKLATAADIIVLDVKYGIGSFMKTKERSRALAEVMVRLGTMAGHKTAAVLSPMESPLGHAVGNALEVREAYDFLCGEEIPALARDVFAVAAAGFVLAKKAADINDGIMLCRRLIKEGKAKKAFFLWLKAQGGIFDENNFAEALPLPQKVYSVLSEQSGYISALDASAAGLTAMELGAGRKTLEDIIDPSAGIVFAKDLGDYVQKNEVLAYASGRGWNPSLEQKIRDFFTLTEECPAAVENTAEIYYNNQWEKYCLTNESF